MDILPSATVSSKDKAKTMHHPNKNTGRGATGTAQAAETPEFTSLAAALEACVPHYRAVADLLSPDNADSDALVAGFLEQLQASAGQSDETALTRSALEQRYVAYLDSVNGGRIHAVYLPIDGETCLVARMALPELLEILK